MTLERVITGGQTGADQAGWRAARAAGIPTGGWMPPDFMTEDGPRMQFKADYGAREIEIDRATMVYPAGGIDFSVAYVERTRLNVRDSDAVVWFGNPYTPGGKATQRAVQKYLKDYYVVVNPGYQGDENTAPLRRWIMSGTAEEEVRVLMVAGNRESKAPGIGAWVESYLAEVFRLLKSESLPTPSESSS